MTSKIITTPKIAMNDFSFGGFKISIDKEKPVAEPKPKPKGLFSATTKKVNEKKEGKSKASSKLMKPKLEMTKKGLQKAAPLKKNNTKLEDKKKPKSVYKSRFLSTKKTVAVEKKDKGTPKKPSFSLKLPSVPSTLPRSAPEPVSTSTPAVPERAFVRPQSTYSARIASYFVFVIFLYFFVNF